MSGAATRAGRGGRRRRSSAEGVRRAIKVGCESAAAKKLEAGLLGRGSDVSVRLLGEVAHDPTDMHRCRLWQGGCLLEEALRRRLACGIGGSEERFTEGCDVWRASSHQLARGSERQRCSPSGPISPAAACRSGTYSHELVARALQSRGGPHVDHAGRRGGEVR